jgi:FG-GAP-like repeat
MRILPARMLSALIICLGFVLLLPQQSSLAVGEFVDSGISFPGLYYSAADWGDYDNDGDLDLALIGQAGGTPSFKLYANQGNQTFQEVVTTIPGRTYANVDWVDYNNDGQLDLLVGGSLTGLGPGGVTTLYQNTGSTFTAVPNTPFAAASYPAFDWGDYDHDGDLDLLFAGRIDVNYGTNVTYVYRNNGDTTFTTIPTTLAGIASGVASWVDYDNDGNLDIFLTGCPDGDLCDLGSTKLYHNNGNGTWTEVNTPFIQVGRSGADWADYDNDGDLDVLILGSYQPGRLYRNAGNGTFQDTGLSFPALGEAMVRWGDYDADGLVDLALAGFDAAINIQTHVYHHMSNGTFVDITAGLSGVSTGGLAWGDYDGNGRLDLLITGCDKVYCTGLTRLYRNTLADPTPTPSSTPTQISTSTSTATPTVSATPTPASTPPPLSKSVFLPMMVYVEPSFPLVISREPIPVRPIKLQGEIFYTTTIRLPVALPPGGTFYLSASPSTPEPAVIDDAIVMRANGMTVFSYDYSTKGHPTATLVQVPRAVLEVVAGQPLTIEFVDVYGDSVGSSPIYLIWQP